MEYGDVYLKDPRTGEVLWQDWCSLDRFKAHYIFQFDAGLFWWVMS